MKKVLLIAVISLLILGIASVAIVLFRFQDQPLPTSLQEAKCTMPITVQGQVMAPAIKAGTHLLLDKCADKQNIPADTVVLFADKDMTMIGRVQEKTDTEGAVSYKVTQDARPEREFTIPADQIIATGQ